MGQAACRPACERRKRTRSSDQAQGAKAYGGREATATRIPHHKPTKPERKQNKTKQNKQKASRDWGRRSGPARPDQTAILILIRSSCARQVAASQTTNPVPSTSVPTPSGLHAPSRGREHYQAPAGRLIATAIARQRPPCRPARTRVSPTPEAPRRAGQNTAVGVGSRRGLFSPPVRRPHVVGSDRSDQPRGACMMSLRPRARASVSCHGPLSRTAQNKNSVAQG